MNSDDTRQATVGRQNQPPRAPSPFWRGVREWVKVIVIALVIAIPIRYFVAEPFVVNGASMDPTFSTGQFLIVDRLTYDFEQPQRGDVLVFKYPYPTGTTFGTSDTYYIKRIIGLPGERVVMNDGTITIDQPASSSTPEKSFVLDEPYVQAYHASHDTASFPPDGMPLGPTQYFVMGDNRAESSDSRAWGPLDRSFFIGRPFVRLTPLTAVSIYPGHYEATSTR